MAEIKLSELRNELDSQTEGSTTFFNIETGAFYTDFAFDRDEEKMEEIDESDAYVRLPSQYDIHEYEMMENFIASLHEGRMQERLHRAIQGRGAFRRFRDVLDEYNAAETWSRYRDAAIEEIGRAWAEENDIHIIEDVPSLLKADEKSRETRKILLVIDMQNDFIDGSLGTSEAQAIVPAVIAKIKSYPQENVYATRDTHPENYLDTQEGRNLPVRHCIKGTRGWQIQKDIYRLLSPDHIYDKPTFGSVQLAIDLAILNKNQNIEIEITGLCTDICVISNALLLKAFMPEVILSVDPCCCAGVTPQTHEAALITMKSCQIQGID